MNDGAVGPQANRVRRGSEVPAGEMLREETSRRLGSASQQHSRPVESRAAPANRTYFRTVVSKDRRELLELARSSRELHWPWISPPMTPHMFKVYLRRTQREDHAGYVICRRDSDAIVGVVNVNNIVMGSFLSASLGYYAAQAHAGQGFMREGLLQLKEHLFRQLGLHRVEANIQPGNTASIALVRSCGFVREGLSRQFLYINGAWRDHERWAALHQREGLR